ncbi:MAG TPA: hypothetical protein VNB06_15600 [Thermoanaerobaculia bacterium]|nr:hypothetical protein [Thermoanaerobaculia bacterium]
MPALFACADGPTMLSDDGGVESTPGLVANPSLPRFPQSTPRLLMCPAEPALSVTATFGEEGGTLRIGAHELRIPAGAVREATTFTATVPAGPLRALKLEFTGREATGLDRPVVARISYARCPRQDLGGRRLTVVSTGDSEDGLVGEEAAEGEVSVVAVAEEDLVEVGGTDDPVEAMVEVEVLERGTYAVAY